MKKALSFLVILLMCYLVIGCISPEELEEAQRAAAEEYQELKEAQEEVQEQTQIQEEVNETLLVAEGNHTKIYRFYDAGHTCYFTETSLIEYIGTSPALWCAENF